MDMDPTSDRTRVLVVDDNPDTVELVCALLSADGHECEGATSGAQALERCEAEHFDCMVLDVQLGDTTGIAIAERLARQPADRPPYIFLMSGHDEAEFAAQLRTGVVDGYLAKTADVCELVGTVHRVLRSG